MSFASEYQPTTPDERYEWAPFGEKLPKLDVEFREHVQTCVTHNQDGLWGLSKQLLHYAGDPPRGVSYSPPGSMRCKLFMHWGSGELMLALQTRIKLLTRQWTRRL